MFKEKLEELEKSSNESFKKIASMDVKKQNEIYQKIMIRNIYTSYIVLIIVMGISYIKDKNLIVTLKIILIFTFLLLSMRLLVPFIALSRLKINKNFAQDELDYKKRIEEKKKNGEKLGIFDEINQKSITIWVILAIIFFSLMFFFYLVQNNIY